MKICPMCSKAYDKKVTVCTLCGYEEKPLSEISQKQLTRLMEPFKYEEAENGGLRITGVQYTRSPALRFNVHIPDLVTEIGDGAFEHCKFIEEFDLPDGLRSIGSRAFGSCKGLSRLYIPESVTHVGRAILDDSLNIEGVYCAAYDKPEGWDDGWLEGCAAWVQWNYKD